METRPAAPTAPTANAAPDPASAGAGAARGFVRTRALPFLALIAASAACTAAGMALVYSRGTAFTVGLAGLLLQLPVAAALTALTWLVLAKLRGLPRDRIGLYADARELGALGVFALAGAATTVLPALALAAAGVARLEPARPAPAVSVLATGLLSFVVNAAIQQLPTQGFGLALAGATPRRAAAIALSTVLFTLAHASPAATPLYALNVALFGAATSLLFYLRPERPSYAAAVGFHGGSNYAFTVLLGTPADGAAHASGFYRWPEHASALSGGRAGLEYGYAWTLVLGALVLTLGVLRAGARSAR